MGGDLDQLKKLESKQNNGRGVSCVRSIIFFIEKGDVQSAENVCFNEGDKIRSYPEIQTLLRDMFPKYNEFLSRFKV